MRKFFTSLFLAALIGASAYACPANRGLIQVPQPDGTLVTIQLNGDEFYSFNTTSDGYTIKLNHAGAYVYAQLNEDGQLVETPILAHDADQRSVVELSLLANTPKRLVDQEEVEVANMRRVKRNVDLSNFDFDNFRFRIASHLLQRRNQFCLIIYQAILSPRQKAPTRLFPWADTIIT